MTSKKFDVTSWENDYKRKIPIYENLEDEALFILEKELKGIKGINFESRIKPFKSLTKKALDNAIELPIDKINDIVGLRIICLFLSDIPIIKKKICESFEVIKIDDKINSHEPNSFGYMSIHFDVEMKKELSGPRYDEILDITFEIQLRTLTMHSWANISHTLDYKRENDIPDDLKRDFFALSGLFYVADKHFEMFFKSREDSIKRIEKLLVSTDSSKYEQEINLDNLTVYLNNKMPDRKGNPEALSTLIEELAITGYKSINDIEKAFKMGCEAFKAFEKENPPSNAEKYAQVGVVRGVFDLIDVEFYKNRSKMNSEAIGKMIDEKEKYRHLIKKN